MSPSGSQLPIHEWRNWWRNFFGWSMPLLMPPTLWGECVWWDTISEIERYWSKYNTLLTSIPQHSRYKEVPVYLSLHNLFYHSLKQILFNYIPANSTKWKWHRAFLGRWSTRVRYRNFCHISLRVCNTAARISVRKVYPRCGESRLEITFQMKWRSWSTFQVSK